MNKQVKLVNYTRGDMDFMIDNGNVILVDDVQEMIAFCARVSNPSNQQNSSTSDRLIKYLVKHKHWSPFEMANACIEINTTRDIARQILRHRSFSFQEFSQRYADPTNDLGFEYREARLQDTKNRQNSIETEDTLLNKRWHDKQEKLLYMVKETYSWAIEHGIAKEQARAVLPEGLTTSRMYVNGTIRSWIHYIEVRTDPGTQKEHRIIAEQCAQELSKVVPIISEFVYNKTPVGEWLGL